MVLTPQPQQRNQGAYRALLYAAAEALLRLHDGGHSQVRVCVSTDGWMDGWGGGIYLPISI